jgi:hypothetical protein
VQEASGAAVPQPARVVEDVDVSTLDAGHVLPNMRAPNERGVWFRWSSNWRPPQTCLSSSRDIRTLGCAGPTAPGVA